MGNADRKTKHGDCVRGVSRLYNIWAGMKGRTLTSSKTHYDRYGGRGIAIEYAPWLDYIPFRDWALTNGYQENLELDRKENNKGYSPDNCRWVTHKANANNRSDTVYMTAFGETKSLTEWSEDPRARIDRESLRHRKRIGWNDWDAIVTPSRREVQYF